MQHRFISYANACDLIDYLNAREIQSSGLTQVFKAERAGLPTYILLTGEAECLVIEEKPELRAL